MPQVQISEMDNVHYKLIRANIIEFIRRVATDYVNTAEPQRLLDIAPQMHEGARPFFPACVTVETLDIDPQSGCTHIGDICKRNAGLTDRTYDYVVCTEVLEHVRRPFDAIQEIWRILKDQGLLFLTCPFNFRIHGPLPDCWRFTEHGLRELLSDFIIVKLNAVETPGRQLMPIHYTVVARKILKQTRP